MNIAINDNYGTNKEYKGEIEFIIRDRNHNIIEKIKEDNLIKIFAKEVFAHRLPYDKVWDPSASSGLGDWVQHDVDIDEFAAKYIVFGASFDDNGNPLDSSDTRYYILDTISGGYIPIRLGVGTEYDGGLINAIPISEPTRPLKRIERIYFEPSYQPAGTPYLQTDVRAINNVVVFETTLLKDEYNGFSLTGSDFFTITEVALVGAREIGSIGACECNPRDIFLTGNSGSSSGASFLCNTSGTATISLDISESEVDALKEGDQIKIVDSSSTAAEDSILNQLNPYYLIISKVIGGRDITLDRVPVDVDNVPLSGQVGVFRDGFRIISHRILKKPVRKSDAVEITTRWRIIFN